MGYISPDSAPTKEGDEAMNARNSLQRQILSASKQFGRLAEAQRESILREVGVRGNTIQGKVRDSAATAPTKPTVKK